MEDLNRLSNTRNFGFIGGQSRVPQKNIGKNISPLYNMHHSASLDDLLTEEQPAWLDELLSEPTSPKINKGHRRSASDTAAYLHSAIMPFKEDELMKSHVAGPSWQFQNYDLWQSTTNGTNFQTQSYGAINRLSTPNSKSIEKHVGKMKEGTSTKPDGSGSKTDSKRIKHQNAHRARLRRLEYISDLERTIQVLQVEGCEMSSAIHYLDQQLIMLSMENRALKQRMDSLAEIQKLKHVEQQFLEREIRSLQCRRQQQPLQNQKQVQPIQQNRHKKYQPHVTQEPESQFAALAI
ncbi:PREDICTED: basic leucine zipper 34-like [Camelina sativa]|uniref:Basic leucine zipper 34-like n=1 Tax=Camelina sativa TaxID=90675 RepID=A0ABM0YF73_CAMSA|nr:PREDICTED: basic leucine zipper 34-like [Camelina sativa]XP_010500034.1 PREDICTED: basic leucine zipper 34-like [Camelina sativa]